MYKKRSLYLILVAITILFGYAYNKHNDTHSDTSDIKLCGAYEVVRVVDGDTIVVNIDGADTKVRFIGVDTPESVNPNASKNTEEGVVASDYTKQLLNGTQVYLEYDVDKTDHYGRTLAYVYLADGVTMVNRLLIEQGYAQIMTIQPNSKYADDFYNTQIKARDSGAGFWNSGFYD